MCVWTKKRGSMNAVVLMATPCPQSLHGKGEKWIARGSSPPFLDDEEREGGFYCKYREATMMMFFN